MSEQLQAGSVTRMTPAGKRIADGSGGDADLVLEGGGVKGIGLAGAIIELDQAGYRFVRVAGTSAGAIAAALVAALNRAGEPITRLSDILQTVDYPRFMAKSRLRQLLGPAGDAEHLLMHMGLYDGDYLSDWLGGVLADLKVTTFADLKLLDPEADSRWTAAQRYSLVVHTSDITRGRLVRLPWDYSEYGLDPDEQRIVDAVRASMSIPFFFQPVRLDAPATESYPAGGVTWVDGGLLDNYPLDVFDRTDGATSRWPTIGIKLSANRPADQAPADCHTVAGEAVACLRTALNNVDRTYVDAEKAARTIFIDTDGISATDFHISVQQQAALFTNGQQAARHWLSALSAAEPPAEPAIQ